ncbi:BEL1-like homeodomain protein 9 [Solanum tuberosum]|uniref:Bel1 homeotic protein n=2 Tax=Solanum tuberosum TaxID=4113 RepID=M1BNG6_SOLTU|nr:PREDICTED: BEL1-like homeodomain protein 9 [Solanum tuberosum]
MAAEGFEAYHVPQQSRRDKLRGDTNTNTNTNFLPNFYNNNPSYLLNPCDNFLLIKSMDPQISSSFHQINNNPFLYNTNQNHDIDVVSSSTYHNNNSKNSITTYVTPGQGLSLSLSSHNHHQRNSTTTSNNSTVPLELNLQRYDSSLFTTVQAAATAADCCNNEFLSSKSGGSTTVGPFTGYASILKGSRFLKPAQQLLEDICGIYAQKLLEDDDSLGIMDDSSIDASNDDGSEHRRNNSKLISMLDEVYRRYKQYYQQLQGVVASFESVPGLGNAAPFANLSLKALSKHFRCLKNAICDQMNYTIKSQTHSHNSQINCDDSTSTRSVGKGNFNYNNFQRTGFVEHHQPVWRPQRGLPERAVTVLRAWLFDHFLHPYPTDSDKVMLAKQTGLSRNQVSNWFINARVRLWKPMVEEIHMLETRQANKSSSQRMQGLNNNNNNNIPIEVHFPTSNNSLPSTSSAQQVPSKRTRNNSPEDEMNLSYSRVGIDQVMSASSGGNGGGVSLTLGLHHQNNNIGIGGLSSESFPRNAARRFGIDANNDGFMFGDGFEPQNHQIGRDHNNNNIIGGQLLHDFVG